VSNGGPAERNMLLNKFASADVGPSEKITIMAALACSNDLVFLQVSGFFLLPIISEWTAP
jgi:hypothetical protein